jgi:hypothetical protein
MNALAFNVIRFTPDPEEVEPANVALIFWGDKPMLVYDDSFPRLACLSPGFDSQLVKYELDDLADRLRESDPKQALRMITGASSQFQVSESKRLFRGHPDAQALRVLREAYLLKRKPGHGSNAATRTYVDSQLQAFLAETLQVSEQRMLRRATPAEFLDPAVYARLKDNGFKISRVINSPRRLVLIDALPLTLSTLQVEQRAQRIASAYYRLAQLKDDIRRVENRDVFRATVLFGAEAIEMTSRKGFAATMVERDSDEVVDPLRPVSPRFGEAVSSALASLS